jgi:hypothetical protein
MATPWDAPPSPDELTAAGWDTPPTPEEMGQPAPEPEKPFKERASLAVRKFFDPGYGSKEPATLVPVGKQALKAASFLIPAAKVAQGAGLLAKVGAGALTGAPAGALYGAGASESDTLSGTLGDAGKGLVGGALVGGALPVLGQGLSWIARKGMERSGLASARAGAKAAEEVAADLASKAGKVGGETQKGSRYVENLMRLEATMTPEQRALYQELQASGVVPNLQQTVAQGTLEGLPGQAATIASRRAELSAAQAAAPEAVASRTAQLLSPAEAKAQIAARLWRYGPPVIGSAVGTAMGGPVGTAVGALAGAGTRPAVQALRRMVKTPAVQKKIGDAMQRIGDNALSRGLSAPVGAEGAVGGQALEPWMENLLRAMGGRPGFRFSPAVGDEEVPR